MSGKIKYGKCRFHYNFALLSDVWEQSSEPADKGSAIFDCCLATDAMAWCIINTGQQYVVNQTPAKNRSGSTS